jgi:DNA-binding protein H-NS
MLRILQGRMPHRMETVTMAEPPARKDPLEASNGMLLLCSLKFTNYTVFTPENAMAKVSLSGMTVEALMDLRKRIDKTLLQHRAEIEQQLEKMDRTIAVVGRPRVVRDGRSALKGRKVPPKYRGPSGETWAGRGARPRWLVAAIKGGRKLDDFLIDKSARKGRRKRRSKR